MLRRLVLLGIIFLLHAGNLYFYWAIWRYSVPHCARKGALAMFARLARSGCFRARVLLSVATRPSASLNYFKQYFYSIFVIM